MEPILCPAGTFSNVRGLTAVNECQACPAGFYCVVAGLVMPSGPCHAGYYCPPGQQLSTAYICPTGHYCPEKSPKPLICASGSYQPLQAQASCTPCDAGYYCDNRQGPVSDITLYPCPRGYFCLAGTQFATQFGCPLGTFSPQKGLQDSSGCLPCAAGMFCSEVGLAAPTGEEDFES
ncbi:signal peptide, CUB and EGF-like domain-containing protein 1 [Erpetoichthys calabaricus]|uniref:signal peptide, CUB and EGF-like domain-containing protein 1 n=1 Tax=Erpetoichthys calabaricus TaxID=27687 RepID=UPI002234A12D|nr:signal peptide, CUB and EGF-like domain-containing protein 1 [Erpetoichthys calabaricus]